MRGCSVVSPGCSSCYAMKQAHRFSGPGQQYEGLTKLTKGGPVWTGDVRLVPEKLEEPLRWRKPRRVFVNSMSDLFLEKVPNEFIAAVFGVMAASPIHTFQVLTKRPERMRRWFEWLRERGGIGPYIRQHFDDLREFFKGGTRLTTYRGRTIRSGDDAGCMVLNAAACVGAGPLDNVWLGVSVEDQARWNERVPLLQDTRAAVRFVSVEPLISPIKALSSVDFLGIGWVIVGGESGRRARRCDVAWVRDIVGQCADAAVPVFVKQLGAAAVSNRVPLYLKDEKGGDPIEWPADLRRREFPKTGLRVREFQNTEVRT